MKTIIVIVSILLSLVTLTTPTTSPSSAASHKIYNVENVTHTIVNTHEKYNVSELLSKDKQHHHDDNDDKGESMLDEELFTTPMKDSGDRIMQRSLIKRNKRYLLTEMQHVLKLANGKEKVTTRKHLSVYDLPKHWKTLDYDFHKDDKHDRDALELAMMRVLLMRKRVQQMDTREKLLNEEEAQKAPRKVTKELAKQYYKSPKIQKIKNVLSIKSLQQRIKRRIAEQTMKQRTLFKQQRHHDALIDAKRKKDQAIKRSKTLELHREKERLVKRTIKAAKKAEEQRILAKKIDCNGKICTSYAHRHECLNICESVVKMPATASCISFCKTQSNMQVCIQTCSAVITAKGKLGKLKTLPSTTTNSTTAIHNNSSNTNATALHKKTTIIKK